MSGATFIVGRRFSARNFWKDVRHSNATVVQYVGETMRYLLAVPPQIDPSTGEDLDKKHNVRLIFGNGLRPDVWNKVKQRFNIPTVAEFYSATEGTSGSWNLSSNDFAAGAVGRNGAFSHLVLSRSTAIVEMDHETEQPWRDPKTGLCKAVRPGDPGELLYAINPEDPVAQFQGYFKNPKATEEKIIRNVLRKGDAYFRTGDMIRWDNEGRWYFSDRLGDTFRWRSENVYVHASFFCETITNEAIQQIHGRSRRSRRLPPRNPRSQRLRRSPTAPRRPRRMRRHSLPKRLNRPDPRNPPQHRNTRTEEPPQVRGPGVPARDAGDAGDGEQQAAEAHVAGGGG